MAKEVLSKYEKNPQFNTQKIIKSNFFIFVQKSFKITDAFKLLVLFLIAIYGKARESEATRRVKSCVFCLKILIRVKE